MTVLLRKEQPGSDSYGHEWRTRNSVVPVSDEQAAELLKITDAGFTVVQVPEPEEADPTPDPAPAPAPDENPVLEIDPAQDDASATPPAHKPRKAAAPARRRSE